MSKMIYNVEDKPKWSVAFSHGLQHLLSIVAATILVPILIGLPEQISAALLGCGLGSITYILITKRKSPVILSSNFAFIGALTATHLNAGFVGILIGGLLTGSVYVILSIIIKIVGTSWINKLLPPIIIGPVVALIGLSLASGAAIDIVTANGYFYTTAEGTVVWPYNLLGLFCALVAFFTIVIVAVQNRFKRIQFLPFLFGILAGYVVALIFTGIGYATNNSYFKIIDFSPIVNNFSTITVSSFIDYPRFALLEGIKEISSGTVSITGLGFAEIVLAFVPISLVSFSEHIADHKNLSTIIDRNLIEKEPGLSRTVLGDGLGSIVGTFFGVCPNTTYGETVGCVAISRDASIRSILTACVMCVLLSFFSPLIAFLRTIPAPVIGGMCLVLYGYIAVSGFKMIQRVNLNHTKNLFTISVILVAGIGGLTLQIPLKMEYVADKNIVEVLNFISVSSIAFALILGVLTYTLSGLIEKHNLPEENNETN